MDEVEGRYDLEKLELLVTFIPLSLTSIRNTSAKGVTQSVDSGELLAQKMQAGQQGFKLPAIDDSCRFLP